MKRVNDSFSKIILLDIDYTLFDAEKYREEMFARLAQAIGQKSSAFIKTAEEIYFSSKEKGAFIPSKFIKKFIKYFNLELETSRLEDLIWKREFFQKSIYREAEEVLYALSRDKNLKIGIFSGGHDAFQKKKIETIKDFLDDDHIHVFMQKEQKLKRIISKYKEFKLYYIDDVLDFLKKAKQINNEIMTVWIKRGPFAKIQSLANFTPDKTITNLIELIPIIKEDKSGD